MRMLRSSPGVGEVVGEAVIEVISVAARGFSYHHDMPSRLRAVPAAAFHILKDHTCFGPGFCRCSAPHAVSRQIIGRQCVGRSNMWRLRRNAAGIHEASVVGGRTATAGAITGIIPTTCAASYCSPVSGTTIIHTDGKYHFRNDPERRG